MPRFAEGKRFSLGEKLKLAYHESGSPTFSICAYDSASMLPSSHIRLSIVWRGRS